jgi:hypothetical protein
MANKKKKAKPSKIAGKKKQVKKSAKGGSASGGKTSHFIVI